MKRVSALLLALALALGLGGCKPKTAQPSPTPSPGGGQGGLVLITESPAPSQTAEPTPSPTPGPDLPTEGEYYYDLEHVVLYLELYGALPDNYITKNEARQLGWTGGSVEPYLPGGAIGGDSFGNREGLLPTAQGRRYTECDLNTLGADSRGAQRLVFSSDGRYFYTADHYESYTEYIVTEDWEVQAK